VFFFDVDGKQIGGLDIAVTRDPQRSARADQAGAAQCRHPVEGLGEGLVLSGTVATQIEAHHAFDIASRLVDDGKKVVNASRC